MIERKITIASFDVYPNSTLKPIALQRYMQQLAREDCDGMGCTYVQMRDVNMVFVMTKLGIDIFEPIFAYDELVVKTFNNRVTGVTFEREFEFFKNGKKVIHATTQWVIVKYDDRKIIRPREFPFEIPSYNLDCGSIELPRIISADNLHEVWQRTVRLSDLDENDHLNNCVYSDIAMDIIPYDRNEDYVKSVRIIFRHEAKINDVLKLSLGEKDKEFVVIADNSSNGIACFESGFSLGKISG